MHPVCTRTHAAPSAPASSIRTVKRYAPEVREAVWAMLCDEVGPAEIMRRLARDKAEIGYPVDMPKASFFAMRKRLISDRGEPKAAIKPGEEIDAANSIRRQALTMVKAQVLELEEIAKSRTLTPRELDQLRKSTQIADEMKRREQIANRGQPNQHKSRARGERVQTSNLSPLQTLARRPTAPSASHASQHSRDDHAGAPTTSTQPNNEDSEQSQSDSLSNSHAREGERKPEPIPA